MRSRARTGDVMQIRKNGPNYIVLGKVTDTDGVEFLAATRNGNITAGGIMKAGRNNQKPKVHIISGSSVKRIHGNRSIDMESVVSSDRRLNSHLSRTTISNGVPTDAPNIMAQLNELRASL